MVLRLHLAPAILIAQRQWHQTTRTMWPPLQSTLAINKPTPPPPTQQPPPPLPDLLAHRYKPSLGNLLKCHHEQARRLRQWILDFTNAPRNDSRHGSDSDSDYDDQGAMSDDSEAGDQTARKCVLLTGPPGVGKTSLVYMIASELKMHIVESHSSEKRDHKLFKMLKLANQKGKINPIAKLFQMSQQKPQTDGPRQQVKHNSTRKKRRLDETTRSNPDSKQTESRNQCLSLSGGSSIVLFDDADVAFEEDGPFLKSLAEFIRESKRPVIVTATRNLKNIKDTLVHYEHIELIRPKVDDCAMMLSDVCRRENYINLDKVTNCKIIAKKLNCDIRQCLNRIHFYGDTAFENIELDTGDISIIEPDFSRLSAPLEQFTAQLDDEDKTDIEDNDETDDEKTILITLPVNQHNVTPMTLACYDTISVLDLMDRAFDIVDKSTLLTRWLDGKPSDRYRSQSYENDLGEQIRNSIVELSRSVYQKELRTDDGDNKLSGIPDQTMNHFSDLPMQSSTSQEPLPIARRLRLRPRRNDTRQGVISPFLAEHIEILNGY